MTASMLGCLAVVSLAAAFLFIFLAPWAERLGGFIGGAAAVGGGLLLLLLSAVAGLSGLGWLAWWAGRVAAASLVWAAFAYLAHRVQRGRARADQATAKGVAPGANCRPRKTFGTSTVVSPPNLDTWRSYLYTLFSTNPTDGQLTESALAWGGAYYGLYYTGDMATLTPTVTIVCDPDEGGKCLADASEMNPGSVTKAPVSVAVANAVSSSGNRVRVAVGMSAALNASGGPSVTAAPGGVGPTVSFPDSSLAVSSGLGTYRWICEKLEERKEPLSEPAEARIGESGREELT